MLELYQFELSSYCEKIRLILDYKGLPYKKVEVTPGVGQIEVYQRSGQRQVPMLKDGDRYIADSTEIAHYLDRQYPDKPILPSDPQQRSLCLLLEDWADMSLGPNGRKGLLIALRRDGAFRSAWLPAETPDFLKGLVSAIPSEAIAFVGNGLGASSETLQVAQADLERGLESLCTRLEDQPYLVGDTPTLADFAVAGLSLYLKFPAGAYLDVPNGLRGRGVPGIADNPAYAPFFAWRDRLYADYRQVLDRPTPPPSADSGPTPITID